MKAGTDISLRVCRQEGYAVVEHGRRPMDPKELYSLTISEWRHWPHGRLRPGIRVRDAYSVNVNIAYTDLWALFLLKGESIKSYCDFENCPFPSPEEDPSFNDFVNLAQTINGYCGSTELQ